MEHTVDDWWKDEPRAAPHPRPHAPAPPTLWQRAGLLVGYPESPDASPGHIGPLAVAHGFGWIAVKIHDGTDVVPGALDWIARFRNVAPSIKVGGWGVQQFEPTAEANLVAKLVHENALDFYIADAEGPYKTDYTRPDGTVGVRSRAAEFTHAFRAVLPTLPAALTTFGAGGKKPDGTGYWLLGSTHDANEGPMDFRSWFEAGFRFLPQAYPNESGETYSVPNCIAHAVAAGWPRSQVHPMLGTYPSRYPYDPAQYVRELHAGGVVGFSTFIAEEMTETDWTTLGAAVGPSGVAR